MIQKIKMKKNKKSETKPDSEPKIETPVDVELEEGKPKKMIKGIKDVLLDKKFPDRTMLINMELRNGMHRTFMICTKKDNFNFMGGTYLIDTNLKYYLIDSKIWCLDYHQDFTLPIKRQIPIAEVQKAVEASGICEVESATNPATLENFIKAKVAEGVMKGQAIDEFLKAIRLMLIITCVAVLIHLALFVFKTGMLQGVKIPGF